MIFEIFADLYLSTKELLNLVKYDTSKHKFQKHFLINWSKGNKEDIILIPGFGETWHSFFKITNELNKIGYKFIQLKK